MTLQQLFLVILKNFNKRNRHIQFTLEIESSKCLPFQDVLLNRQDGGKIHTNLSSNSIPNFLSAHPIIQKISIIKGDCKYLPPLFKKILAQYCKNTITQYVSSAKYCVEMVSRLE